LNGDWKTGDYDIYLWDWWFSPMVEPSLDVCELYHTNSIGNNTDVNDYYPPFDDWYYASLRTTDFTERKELVDTMQRWAYENSGYWPIAYRDNTYLAQTTTRQGGQGWTNYGDWVAHYTLCPDSDYWWLFLKIYPADQPSPTIGTFSIDPADTEHPITYTAEATDTNNMEYRWIFGDGTSTSWSSSMDVIKTYADDGYYEARLVVRESDGSDNFMVFAKQTVTVINNTNVLPVVNAWTPSPSNPTLGELVYFNGSATDANTGDTLSYSWDFGDGNITAGQSVTHRFIESTGVYSVKLSVDDGHLGTVPRPATKTQSLQILSNGPPYEVAVGDYGNVGRNVPYTFSLTASDPNPRDVLRYTWVWGDGQTSVTTTKSTRHTYQNNALYTLTVWADDQTGIAGHNVSDTGLVQVKNPTGNTAPTMTTSGFGVSAATPWTGKVVQFWANATDANGNLLDIVIDFGDGTTSGTITQSDPNATVTVTHVYETEDMFFPSVTFTDQIAAAITRYSTDMVPSWYVTSQGAYFDLDLVTGWNFVTVPPMNYGYTASMLGGTVDQVAKWDPVAPGYVIWWSMFPTKNNFAIEGSTGYWVLATAPGTVRLFGDMPTTSQTRTITVPTGGAWVMIGFNSLRTDWTATSVVGMYTGGTVQQVAKWNPVAGYTIWWDMFPTKNNFALVPGQSYWILVTASGQLTYTP
jgi:PKD repeat protein